VLALAALYRAGGWLAWRKVAGLAASGCSNQAIAKWRRWRREMKIS
jgi:hypothetical protein